MPESTIPVNTIDEYILLPLKTTSAFIPALVELKHLNVNYRIIKEQKAQFSFR